MTTATTVNVTAADVEVGDFLPGIGNGYVFAVSTDHDYRTEYNTTAFRDDVEIMFHTADGDEATLFLPPESPVTVDRP